MKRFNITVNGVSYDVTVEEVASAATAAQPAVVAPAPVQKAAPAAAAAPASTVANAPAAEPAKPAATPAGKEGSVVIKCPMPGTIMKVNVSVGDTVKKGDVLCVLEAMKMENDISAPGDGTVASVNVQKGASVQTDDVLVTLN